MGTFDDRIKDLEAKTEKLSALVEEQQNFLKHCAGQPTIQGFGGKRLDLNDNLNVLDLWDKVNNPVVAAGKALYFSASGRNITSTGTIRLRNVSGAIETTHWNGVRWVP